MHLSFTCSEVRSHRQDSESTLLKIQLATTFGAEHHFSQTPEATNAHGCCPDGSCTFLLRRWLALVFRIQVTNGTTIIRVSSPRILPSCGGPRRNCCEISPHIQHPLDWWPQNGVSGEVSANFCLNLGGPVSLMSISERVRPCTPHCFGSLTAHKYRGNSAIPCYGERVPDSASLTRRLPSEPSTCKC